jgi:membrane protease YdiL (CAAX protease family)
MAITTPQPTADLTAGPPIEDRPDVPQYSLGQIAAVWAAAALPMAFLAWVLAPWLGHRLDGPSPLSKALLLCLTGGLIWQFVVVVALVAREQRSLRWSRVRAALWLNAPQSPRTGRRGGRIWLVLMPLTIAFGAEELIGFSGPANRNLGDFLGSHAGHALLSGSPGWFAVIVAAAVFNTVLGEELLFRGLLLPRMNGVFGRRDWLVNGVLFAAYHLHMPWVMPATLADSFLLAYPSKRYPSALIGIAVHSAQSVVLVAITISLLLG